MKNIIIQIFLINKKKVHDESFSQREGENLEDVKILVTLGFFLPAPFLNQTIAKITKKLFIKILELSIFLSN